MTMIEKVAKASTAYPFYSQENTALDDKIVCMKLFDQFGSGTWYITEYNPTEQTAFGYVE